MSLGTIGNPTEGNPPLACSTFLHRESWLCFSSTNPQKVKQVPGKVIQQETMCVCVFPPERKNTHVRGSSTTTKRTPGVLPPQKAKHKTANFLHKTKQSTKSKTQQTREVFPPQNDQKQHNEQGATFAAKPRVGIRQEKPRAPFHLRLVRLGGRFDRIGAWSVQSLSAKRAMFVDGLSSYPERGFTNHHFGALVHFDCSFSFQTRNSARQFGLCATNDPWPKPINPLPSLKRQGKQYAICCCKLFFSGDFFG